MILFSKLMRILAILLFCYSVAATAFAQDPGDTQDDRAEAKVDPQADATQELAEQRFKTFLGQAADTELVVMSDQQRLVLREQPLQKFSSEGKTFGSVYLWEHKGGRPGVIGTIGSLPINGRDFGFIELHWLLSEAMKPVTVGKAYPKLWKANGDELAARKFADAPSPHETAQGRLVQMRGLAREFTATMANEQGIHELRLLPQPLYRYEDSTLEKDGAIFAMVWTIGTDPELLLHLQTITEGGQTAWHWQPIRFTWRSLKLRYCQDPIWEAEEFLRRDDVLQTGPYITTLTEPIK